MRMDSLHDAQWRRQSVHQDITVQVNGVNKPVWFMRNIRIIRIVLAIRIYSYSYSSKPMVTNNIHSYSYLCENYKPHFLCFILRPLSDALQFFSFFTDLDIQKELINTAQLELGRVDQTYRRSWSTRPNSNWAVFIKHTEGVDQHGTAQTGSRIE